MDKEAQHYELSKKYNLQAMNDYNFDNFTFDINFGEVTEKDLDRMKKEEAEYQEELRKQEEANKQRK